MFESAIHLHPWNQDCQVYGRRLEALDVIEPGDRFDCLDGSWTPCSASILGKTVAEAGNLIVIRLMPLP